MQDEIKLLINQGKRRTRKNVAKPFAVHRQKSRSIFTLSAEPGQEQDCDTKEQKKRNES